ncbi:MAG: hypothetical protein L0287_07815 [Anaerolineae bacterium]|nr:hypothetical protein [Anaerolineae bacterium]MCI0610875.1 hypothetical protein [Anaerolineae bacterium]
MRKKNRHSSFLILLILGIGLPGFIGILGIQAKAVANQPEMISSILQIADTVTPTMLQATSTLLASTPTDLPLSNLQPSGAFSPGLHAFIQAPNGVVPRPYVILTAFSSLPRTESVTIGGFVNSQEFICTESPCVISLQSNARFVFRAYTGSGATSEEVIASVRVTQNQDGYIVTIDSVSQFTTFGDSCSLTWGVQDETSATWDSFVQFPYQLNTKKTLHTLATQLILNGIVDTRDCPAGGLSLGLKWPTACGLERSSTAMIAWQNQFDEYIWLASKNHGIPPKVLKTLIEIESQFWPGNSRFYLDEYGLGQLNQLGVDVLLRKDPAVYQRVCAGVLSDCLRPYQSLEPSQQALIRGALVNLADASCATCEYGIDLDKAKESVSLIAMLLKANCQQVDVILDLAARANADEDADAATATAAVATATAAGGGLSKTTYEDLWRFTFVAYHSGLSCVQTAVQAVEKASLPVTWENVSNEFKCKGSEDYADGFMNNLFSFDLYLYQFSESDVSLAAPTFVPTRTPIPTPTVFISTAQVRVEVFMDRNNNGSPEDGEWIDAMTVLLTTSTNEQITQRTQNGVAIFDMTGFPPGIGINVSLPGLYRSESFVLPEQGEVSVTFVFEQPALPTLLP